MTYDVGHPGPGLRGIDLNISVLHIVCYYMSMVDILIYMYFTLQQSLKSLIPQDGRLTSSRSTWIYIQVILFYERSAVTQLIHQQRLCTINARFLNYLTDTKFNLCCNSLIYLNNLIHCIFQLVFFSVSCVPNVASVSGITLYYSC